MEGLVSLGGLWKSEGIYRNAIIINRHSFYVPTHVLPREVNAPAPIQGARKRQQILRGIERSVSSSVYPSVRASVYLSISPSFRPSVRQSVSIRLFTDIFRQANDYMALFLPTVPYRFLSSFFFRFKVCWSFNALMGISVVYKRHFEFDWRRQRPDWTRTD